MTLLVAVHLLTGIMALSAEVLRLRRRGWPQSPGRA